MLQIENELFFQNGLAIPCNPGETGEMVGVINNKVMENGSLAWDKCLVQDLMQRFDGYVGKEETNKKIYRDVFKKGDQVSIQTLFVIPSLSIPW